ncbi:hypothetical protein GCM10022240_31180 [Microbacterium kribbense]|uniref:Uncharacterized protein n=1 Tax=Microbacterium kribbense TaxID=433645 RepID=A0ABP7GZ80_9MICO
MSELTRNPLAAFYDVPVEEDATADSFTDRDHRERCGIATCSEQLFRVRERANVVLHVFGANPATLRGWVKLAQIVNRPGFLGGWC